MSKFYIIDSTTSAARATGSGGLNQGSSAGTRTSPRDQGRAKASAAGTFAGQGIALA